MTRLKRRVALVGGVTLLIAAHLLLCSVLYAAENGSPGTVAVLPFWAFDQEGNVVPRASETDLARLASLLPRAVAARLIQAGDFDVLDPPLLESRGILPPAGSRELDQVAALLARGDVDQVITGTVAQVQQAVITGLRRYVPGPEGPRLEGAAVVRSNSASEAINSVENLLVQVFPPEADVVPRPIARIVVVPNVLRIPIGGTAPLQAYAVDDLGRTLTTVQLFFQTNDETRVTVDEQGNVTGVSPGKAQIHVQPLGRPLASGVSAPTVDVTVAGPSLGLRAGASISADPPNRARVGLRLTPAHEIRTSSSAQTLPQAGSNPVNYLTSFFGALIGNQMLTMDLDLVPGQDISMTLNAVQRTTRGYFGTGIGVAVPMSDEGPSGVLLRLTLGGTPPFGSRSQMTFPVEVNVDFILGAAQSPPQARIGVSVGIDLFQ